jgi:hypothetical protein
MDAAWQPHIRSRRLSEVRAKSLQGGFGSRSDVATRFAGVAAKFAPGWPAAVRFFPFLALYRAYTMPSLCPAPSKTLVARALCLCGQISFAQNSSFRPRPRSGLMKIAQQFTAGRTVNMAGESVERTAESQRSLINEQNQPSVSRTLT